MRALLSWTTYGTWLPGPARGCVEAGQQNAPTGDPLPEPDAALSARRRRALKWPAVRLDAAQRTVIQQELVRVSALRRFTCHAVVIAPDHVHLVLSFEDDDRDLERLVQLIKGSLARALSVAAGDPPASSVSGAPLPHHKWWTRQYSSRPIMDSRALARIIERLRSHRGEETRVWIAGEE